MNNTYYKPDKEFVINGKDEENSADIDYEDQDFESTKKSYRKLPSLPVIIGALGFLILNILITVFISNGADSTGGEQIQVIETRLEGIEAELISMTKDIEGLKSSKRASAKQKSPTVKNTSSTQRSPTGAKPKIHKVQPGDSLSKIGQQYGLSVKQLHDYNSLEPNAIINPGQKLNLVP